MARSSFELFLNVEKWAGSVPLVNPRNPVRWARVATAIILGTFTSLVLGLQRVISAYFAVPAKLLEGATEFITGTERVAASGDDLLFGLDTNVIVGRSGLLDVMFDPIILALRGLHAFNVQQFGLFALPVTLALTLASVYLFTQALVRAYRIVIFGLRGGWL